jgi:phospholipid/cholesterol/gamma-HCH transport system substrate-binding protein
MERDESAAVPRNLQFRVGLLLGLTIMVAAVFIIYALYARGVFEATQRLTLVSDNAEGVSIGMDLTFSGFPIGRVQRIALGEDGRARIEIDIPRKDARWLRNSSIFTLERGIVGGARIRAFTGNLQDDPLPDNAERGVLRGDTQEEIPRMVATLRSVLENVEQMTGADGSLQASLANVRAATERLGGRHGALGAVLGNEDDAKKVIAAIDRANALLASLGGVARRIDGVVGSIDGVVGRADQRLLGDGGVVDGTQRAVNQANTILNELRESLKRVDRILADAQAVSGNARAATTDLAALRAEVDASVRKVSGLIDEINRKWPFQRESEIRLP